MVQVDIDPAFESQANPTLLVQAAEAALAHQKAPENVLLTIVITDDAQLHQLNLEFLGVDAPTDVLSFPDGSPDPETGEIYLGDILISLPYAARQAAQGGHALEAELQLLAVHGTLHLMGHDHAEEAEKAAMWQAQADILAQIGCPLSPP